MNAVAYYTIIACIVTVPDIQVAPIENLNASNASEIMRIARLIDMHNETIASTSNTTTSFNNIIDSAHTIIDSAHTIIGIARDIVYNTSTDILHHSGTFYTTHDTISHASANIITNATNILLDYKHFDDNYDVNTHHALEIISSADEVITKANNHISLANEARRKLQAESLSSWISWENIAVPAMCTAAILIMATTIDISSFM